LSIKAAVVGVGYLGRHHARIYADLEGVELVGVVDSDPEARASVAARCGCKAFADYHDVLDDVQALSIATPTSTHHEIALACLRAGKDLLVEKPLASTVREADALVEEADKWGCVLQVGHLERYNPAVVAIAGLVREPEFIESERVSPFLGRGTDVDVTLDLMIHDVDIVTSLLGGAEVADVRVVGAKVLTDKVDVVKAWVDFEGGVSALITASRISRAKQRLLKIYQKDGFLLLNYQDLRITRHFKNGTGDIRTEVMDVEAREPLREELSDFIQCVRWRRRPRVSGREGRNALRVTLDITSKIRNASGI
jgi:predicted dehydrogenase